ncbi:helix-turn-helix domain-containing protein [Litchfieldia salsa]|uniref:AraC-type DNA-binding protein n=1 Tax=Litchfieldia salsa TaxID=930152 RepID=A0A1H0VS20_9BACI|nr:helix-turn-helix domain-containing protein [Litchfieldia salsa]SDP81051.1 AraC-type DNA-binding protein [Litchfieldia salsa]
MQDRINGQLFFPSQPEIGYITDNYIEFSPLDPNEKNVSLFYQFKTNHLSVHSLTLIPDGCFDILFCCSPTNPSAILWTSPFQRRFQPNFHYDCDYFGVRFFPEQSILKLNFSMKELLDQRIPLFDVLSLDSSIIEEIGLCISFTERIQVFCKYLYDQRVDDNYDQRIVDYCIQKIYSSRGSISISKLEDMTGYSDRYIRRKFEAYIGFSPNEFSQIVKFQRTLTSFLDTDSKDMIDIIQENGYFDQSHFYRHFKKFMGVTPKQFKQSFKSVDYMKGKPLLI